jgi:hypothetical protein
MLMYVRLLKISAEPDCRAHAETKLGQDLVSELEYFADSDRIEVLSLVAGKGIFFNLTILRDCLE